MSALWNLLDGGYSMPGRETLGQRLALWCGRRLALRHRHVTIPRSCRIHPEARMHPRRGAIRLGQRCTIAPGAVVQGNVELGDDCSIQLSSILIGYGDRENRAGLIRIGNGVRIAPMVIMVAGDHVFADPAQPIHTQGLQPAPITIEDDVWIASRVNITAGVTIGRGCVVGAGAVVTRDLPPLSVAVGIPAKVVGTRGQSGRQAAAGDHRG